MSAALVMAGGAVMLAMSTTHPMTELPFWLGLAVMVAGVAMPVPGAVSAARRARFIPRASVALVVATLLLLVPGILSTLQVDGLNHDVAFRAYRSTHHVPEVCVVAAAGGSRQDLWASLICARGFLFLRLQGLAYFAAACTGWLSAVIARAS